MSRYAALNPFRTLPPAVNAREVWAWGMYDLANQSFQLLINTLLFSIYMQKVVYVNAAGMTDEDAGKRAWGMMAAVSMALVVVASPVLGALADQRAWKREMLIVTGGACVALMAAMPFVGPGDMALAVALYIPAAFACGIGENFLGSFLPEISTPESMGRVSAIGWTMSYIGALMLLAVCGVALWGLGLHEPRQWRWLFLFASGWFLIGMLPLVIFLREKARPLASTRTIHADAPIAAAPVTPPARSIVGATFHRLMQTVRDASKHRQLFRFLGVFFIYSLGTQTVIYFAAIIGDALHFEIRHLVLMALIMSITAGIGAFGAGAYQDRIGHRRTVMTFLAAWIVGTLGLALMQRFQAPQVFFWPISAVIGFALGGIGTSSRALVGVLTPREKAAEFFGLWGMVYKAAIIGPVVFSLVSTKVSQSTGLFVLCGAFVAGLVLMLGVREQEGPNAGVAPTNCAEPGSNP
ncbi:MAG: MFS transporter [Phycisphaerales bacterium]